jgi:nitrous oxide reductase
MPVADRRVEVPAEMPQMAVARAVAVARGVAVTQAAAALRVAAPAEAEAGRPELKAGSLPPWFRFWIPSFR